MQTSLRGIANKAAQNKTHRFQNLYRLLTLEFLLYCWQFVNKKAASGVDRINATEYALNLHGNVEQLEASVKGGWYRAKLVLRKYIPKLNGKLRPLGIPAIADKLLQMAVAKLLEAIYEQDFLPCSYGYRPGTGAHKAIKELSATLRTGRYSAVVEADIKGFFDHIDHTKLLNMLMQRINDKPLLKLIRRWLKAGILDTTGQVLHPLSGTPQGGIVTPLTQRITFIDLCRIVLGRRFRRLRIAPRWRCMPWYRMFNRNQIFSYNDLFNQQFHNTLALTDPGYRHLSASVPETP